MESPVKGSGWTGRMEAPRTVERKRNGRHTDRIVLPTPPRRQEVSHLPTPDSVRRPAKPVDKVIEPVTSAQPTMLPTPQTLPRQPRKAVAPPSSGADDTIMTPPSPTGHTTFYLSTSNASGSRGEKISRRRPGLTFAQQMGLASSSVGRPGVGVGMGGSRSGAHKKDQVVWGHLAEPVALGEGESEEENPFLVKPTQRVPKAPGRSTLHEPRRQVEDENTAGVGSLQYNRSSPVLGDTGMLTPPPTRPERGVRTVPKPKVDPAEIARKREAKEQMKRMMDVESNPFLVKPGEPSRPRQRLSPLADESKPTVTYVFRGAKKVFANPFYPTDAPFPQSLLDPEDEDYEPHPNPKPRLLWPSPPPRSKRINLEEEEKDDEMDLPSGASPPSSPIATPRRRLFAKDTVHLAAAAVEDDDEEEDVDMSETPTQRRLFAPPKRPAESAQELGREEKRIKGMRV